MWSIIRRLRKNNRDIGIKARNTARAKTRIKIGLLSFSFFMPRSKRAFARLYLSYLRFFLLLLLYDSSLRFFFTLLLYLPTLPSFLPFSRFFASLPLYFSFHLFSYGPPLHSPSTEASLCLDVRAQNVGVLPWCNVNVFRARNKKIVERSLFWEGEWKERGDTDRKCWLWSYVEVMCLCKGDRSQVLKEGSKKVKGKKIWKYDKNGIEMQIVIIKR